MTIEQDVLKKVKPTAAENRKLAKVIEELTDMVLEEARRQKVHIEPMLVGSVAKRTHLKDPDIDLFMLFQESTTLPKLKENGLSIGKAVIEGREHYAQHPYVRGMYKGHQVDLVPAFRIRDARSRMSAVDRTPFHTEFIQRNLEKGAADEVRLLKQFMKGIECYGAEAKVQGFSGYLCELLVIRFGGFREVLESATGWRVGESITLQGHPSKEFPEPLDFVDPVDPARNVASAVSVDSLLRFIMASREYLRAPSARFFFPNGRGVLSQEDLRARAGGRLDRIVSVSFPKLDLIDDVLYPQLRKSLNAIAALLQRNDFSVEKSTMHVDDRIHLVLELESLSLPKERKHRGPPVNSENVGDFLDKWRTLGMSAPYVEDGRWFVMARREHERADELVRVKLRELTLGKDVKKLDSFEVLTGEGLLREGPLAALTHHFEERMPWER